MATKFGISFRNMGEALVAPEKAFRKEEYLKTSLFLLFLSLYLLSLASALISTAVMSRPEMQEFQFSLAVRQAEKNMIGASEADKEMMREQVRQGMNSPAAKIGTYVSIVISSGFWLLFPLAFWGLQNIAARFFGGEETPVSIEKRKGPVSRKHRRSLFFSLMAHLPVLFYSLAASLVIAFRNPDSLTNVLTMDDLIAKMDVDFSLFGLLVSAKLPIFLDTVFSTVTNPFYWWMFFIAWFGLKEVWRLKRAGIITILALWVLFNGFWAWGSYALAGAFTA